MDQAHLFAALRYVERNPVRAGMRSVAEDWPWSSASAHIRGPAPKWLDLAVWRATFTPAEWRAYVAAETFTEAERMLRVNTYTGRPVGSQGFIERMEAELGRVLRPGKVGRPKRAAVEIAGATVAGAGQGILIPGG